VDGPIQAFAGDSPSTRSGQFALPRLQTARCALLLITIIAAAWGHPHIYAQDVPSATPPVSALPEAPLPVDLAALPRATPLPAEKPPQHAVLLSDTQTKQDDTYTLDGDVEIDYGDHVLRADHLTYNQATGDVLVEGHVHLTGGENDESIEASHGSYNLKTQTGKFYDVNGSVQVRDVSVGAAPAAVNTSVIGATAAPRQEFATSNPFLFRGRMVVKTGPQDYTIYDGAVTSCLLPHPDWELFGRRFTLYNGKAAAVFSTFRLLGVPVLFLPAVTHPTDTTQRQSGILIPVLGYSSASQNTGSKGTTIGEQAYLTLGRSADLTVGTLYYSLRGFSENGTFRYRGPGDDFLTAHFSALQDRGFVAPSVNAQGVTTNVYTNQGGEDVTAGFRRQLATNTRVAADAEYLSTYVYRQAFTENFNQAVSSDILSILYATRQVDGFSMDARVDRYQGLKVVPTNNTVGEEVKIFHTPSFDFTGVDRPIPGTKFLWNITASAAGLKRVQPNFVSSGVIERVDVRPELALPLAFAGWHTMSSVAFEETAYTRSRKAPYGNGAVPVELVQGLNRMAVDLKIDIRPPVAERTFTVPERWRWLLGSQVRHTIEPQIVYRDVKGVDNFLAVLRFDDTDLVSNTNELQYGVTQHLFFRPRVKPAKLRPGCPAPTSASEGAETPASETPDDRDVLNPTEGGGVDANGIPNSSIMVPDAPTRTHARHADPCTPDAAAEPAQQEWFTWTVTQKIFFDQLFGGAVIDRRRNIFASTLDLSGIAFLTEPRILSPVVSRMRFRTSSHTDVGWDFDYDTGATKFNSSNVYVDAHEGRVFGGFSFAALNAPGRFYTENITNDTLTGSATSNFSQLRLLLGYGAPNRAGISAAGGAGVDLKLDSAQYVTLQTSYNWNCCGLTVEYRKYNLGTVRDDGTYRFNFTLANIGTAGNLRRAEALF
jgi:LPS-assembly protein